MLDRLPMRITDAWDRPESVPGPGYVVRGGFGSLTLVCARDHFSRTRRAHTKILTWRLVCASCRDEFRFTTGIRTPRLKLVCRHCYHMVARVDPTLGPLLRASAGVHLDALERALAAAPGVPHSFWLYAGEERLTLGGERLTRQMLEEAHVVPGVSSPGLRRPETRDTMGWDVVSSRVSVRRPRETVASLRAEVERLRRLVGGDKGMRETGEGGT